MTPRHVTVGPGRVRAPYRRGHLGPALRVGLRYVRGLGEDVGRRIEAARRERPFASIADLAARVQPSHAHLTALAEVGALGGIGEGAAESSRRDALWQVESIGRSGPLFLAAQAEGAGRSPLDEMDEREALAADYRVAGLTTGRHPMALRRAELARAGVLTAAEVASAPGGRRVRVAGAVIVRQRPGSAKGFFFMTLEDETGLANVIVTPAHFTAHRSLLVSSSVLVVEGLLQKFDGTASIKADRFFPLDELATPARDFH